MNRSPSLTLKGYKWQGGTAVTGYHRVLGCDHVQAAACFLCADLFPDAMEARLRWWRRILFGGRMRRRDDYRSGEGGSVKRKRKLGTGIEEYEWRRQPFTVWVAGFVERFCSTRMEAEAVLAAELGRRAVMRTAEGKGI